jgi:zinc/manganese transport system ATP-binding protein
MARPAFDLRDLTVGYGRRPAVHHVRAALPKASLIAVVGPNGAGKSTLLKALTGELKPLSGALVRDGFRARDIAFMPQLASLDRAAPLSVGELVVSGLWRRCGLFGQPGRDGFDKARAALEAVGLAGFENRALGSVSGGQLQRALFARVIAQDCPVIVLDEPFAALDVRTAGDLLEIVAGWGAGGRTVIAALHDLDMVRARFSHALLLARNMIDFGPSAQVLSGENLLRARRMEEAWRVDAETCAA